VPKNTLHEFWDSSDFGVRRLTLVEPPAHSVEPPAHSVEPPAYSVEPPAHSVEPVAHNRFIWKNPTMMSSLFGFLGFLFCVIKVALASTDTLTAWLKHAQEQQQAQSGVPTVRRPPVGSPSYGFPSNNTLSIPTLEDGACTGYICGNKQFITEPTNGSVAKVPAAEKVKIIVFSVWVGNEPLEVNKLNHKQYCDANGYEYKHFYLNNTEFAQRYTTQPSAWLSVFAAKELLATSDAQYFFKMDIDCLFVRNDVRLETLIDPLQRYSFYTTNIDSQSRFMQSQSWILKNSEFGKAFIAEWLEYVHWGRCGNLAMEQGAMHLAIGMAYKWSTGDSSTAYICPHWCKCP
jgi:hypothetical protein